MLVVTDRRMLDDGNVRGKEAYDKYVAGTAKLLFDTYTLYDHNILKNVEMRSGQRMHHSEFITKVTALNPTIWTEQQINFENDLGLYTEVDGTKVFLSQLTKGWLPEFSYIILDHQNLPDSQVMGWRAALCNILKKGGLSWRQVLRTFGDSETVNSYRWAQSTKIFRAENCCSKIASTLAAYGA
jgi:hypothetical protein